jgi:hypothetical protein
MRALAAIRSICGHRFLSAEQVNLPTTLIHPSRPVSVLNGMGELVQWTVPNVAGHRRMLRAAGFEIERTSRPYTIPYGVSHAPRGRHPKALFKELLERVMAGGPGVPHAAALCHIV